MAAGKGIVALAESGANYRETIDRCSRVFLLAALRANKGRVEQAADKIGVSVVTMKRHMGNLGIVTTGKVHDWTVRKAVSVRERAA